MTYSLKCMASIGSVNDCLYCPFKRLVGFSTAQGALAMHFGARRLFQQTKPDTASVIISFQSFNLILCIIEKKILL